MADRATTTAAPPRRTSAAGNGNRTSARPNQSTARASRASRPPTIASTATSTPTISAIPSSSSETAGGPSGAMIGGIAAGVVMVFGLVGLLFYKKRKRAAVAAAEQEKSKAIAMSGTSAPISGPMALAPEKGIDSAPAHRPEAHFREQQQFRPGMRDELFAQPGSALHTTLTNKNKSNTTLINNDSRTNLTSNNIYNNNSNNNGPGTDSGNIKGNNNQAGKPKGGPPASDGYYDDEHLVHDYYGGADSPETVGAQRPAPQSRDVSHGNLTPAPEYYLGKEDIDPRRDLRGLDSPETYVRQAAIAGSAMGSDPRQMQGTDPSRYSDDRDSVYMTPEQAQQAHNHRMRGPKDSIGSVAMLHLEHSSPPPPQERATHRPPDHSLSVAMTESTMSVMPSLPPADGGLYDPRMQQQQRPGGGRPSPPGPGPGPQSPMSSIAAEDPYAESAYSDEYRDDRSMVSSGYPQHRQQPYRQQYPHDNGRGSPYSPGPMSPPYDSHQYPQQQGYGQNRPYHGGSPPYNSSRPQQPPRGNNGGGGYGPGRPGPGPGPGYGMHHAGPQQGYRAPQQRDPGYNEGPYRRQY